MQLAGQIANDDSSMKQMKRRADAIDEHLDRIVDEKKSDNKLKAPVFGDIDMSSGETDERSKHLRKMLQEKTLTLHVRITILEMYLKN